jgi:hypothetical protein
MAMHEIVAKNQRMGGEFLAEPFWLRLFGHFGTRDAMFPILVSKGEKRGV